MTKQIVAHGPHGGQPDEAIWLHVATPKIHSSCLCFMVALQTDFGWTMGKFVLIIYGNNILAVLKEE